jgi:TATA-box binding protein (TBP) (component of TFIID and TFIIIB)
MPQLGDELDAIRELLRPLNANVRVSTTTMAIATDLESVNIGKLIHKWDDPDIYLRIPGEKKDGRKRKTSKSFFNSVTAVYNPDGKRKRCVKVFSNGRLHVTGCQTREDSLDAATRVARVMSCNIKGSAKLLMMNVCVNVSHFCEAHNILLNLHHMEQAFKRVSSTSNISTSYDPNIYHGLRIKYPDLGTLLCFASGNVILAGIKGNTPEESIRKIKDDFFEFFLRYVTALLL